MLERPSAVDVKVMEPEAYFEMVDGILAEGKEVKMRKNWKTIAKIVVAVLTALLSAIGGAAASGVQI